MYRKYYLVEVVLLLLLSHGGWNGPSVTLLSCTSESSRLVRDVVQKRFLSVVERYRGVSLPLECPLHPRRDMFWWLQTELEATKKPGEETWHCPVCGKKFRCENTFVTHWDASHSRTLGMVAETVCLDDYCDVFRCDVLRKRMLRQRMEEEEELRKGAKPSGIQPFVSRRPLVEEDEETKTKKKNCDSNAMKQVHTKCRSLVRQCTIGMLANLSSKDFQDIEDDLDQAICSFLTCDRYWDDFDSQIHHIPSIILAIFGLLIISFFCFCYYGTWILLEKQPILSNQVCCNCQKMSFVDVHHRQKQQKHEHKQQSSKINQRPKTSQLKHRPNSMDLNNKLHLTKYNYNESNGRQDSPDYFSRKNCQAHISKHNPLEYSRRQNSPEYSSRQNSPEYNSRQISTEYNSRQNSPDYSSRQNSPEYSSRQDSPEYSSRQYSPEYSSRQNSPENISRQNSPEYNGRPDSLVPRSIHVDPHEYISQEDYAEYTSRQNSPEDINRQDSSEYNTRQKSPEYSSKQKSPEYIISPKSSEYVSKQKSPDYITRQHSLDFETRQKSEYNNHKHLSPEYIIRQNKFNARDDSLKAEIKQHSLEFEDRQNTTEFQTKRRIRRGMTQ